MAPPLVFAATLAFSRIASTNCARVVPDEAQSRSIGPRIPVRNAGRPRYQREHAEPQAKSSGGRVSHLINTRRECSPISSVEQRRSRPHSPPHNAIDSFSANGDI